MLTPVFNSRKPCRSRFLFCARPSLYIMCLSVVYRHLFYFFSSSSHFFSPAPRITRSSPEHNATRSCVSIVVRPARSAKGPMVVVFAVKASAVRHRGEGVVDGGPTVGEGGVGVVSRTTDRGGRGLPRPKGNTRITRYYHRRI